MKRLPLLLIGLLVILSAMVGCTSQPMVQVTMTDAFIPNAEHLYLQVTDITLVPKGNEGTENGHVVLMSGVSREIDVLATRSNPASVLGSTPVPAGTYSELRMVVVDTHARLVFTDGTEADVKIPSAASSGLKLKLLDSEGNDGVTFENGAYYGITVDFDAWKSVEFKDGSYKLSPVARAAMTQTSGKVIGQVVAKDSSNNLVPVSGVTVKVNDQNGVEVLSTATDGEGKFYINALMASEYAGNYTVIVDGTTLGYNTVTISDVVVTKMATNDLGAIEISK